MCIRDRGYLAGGGVVGLAVGVVGHIKVLGLVLRVVVHDQLYVQSWKKDLKPLRMRLPEVKPIL